jgi:integrase
VHVGGGKYRSKSFTRQRDAEKWREAMQVAKETGSVETVDADLQTLSALAAEHMTAARPDLAPSTFKGYRDIWRAHVHGTTLASLPLRAIVGDPSVIEAWLRERRAAGAGESSLRKTLVLMQAMFERAVRFGRIPRNPVKLVRKPRATRTIGITPVVPAQVEAIRAGLTGADAVMVSVLAYAGVRPGEARALRWSDVKSQTLVIERAVSGVEIKATKTGAKRSVRLLGPLADDLRDWRTVCGNPAAGVLIFPRADGDPWSDDDWRNWRTRKFAPAAIKAGVQIGRPYDLRHSAASLWIQEGINPVQIAAWLGHSPSMLLSTYAHVIADVDPADRTPAVEQIEAARRDMSVTWERVNPGPAQATPAAPDIVRGPVRNRRSAPKAKTTT